MCDFVLPDGLELTDDVKIEFMHNGMKKVSLVCWSCFDVCRKRCSIFGSMLISLLIIASPWINGF